MKQYQMNTLESAGVFVTQAPLLLHMYRLQSLGMLYMLSTASLLSRKLHGHS